MTEIQTFAEALEDSEPLGKRHLLLGNGFSRSKFEDKFAYKSLFALSNFPDDSKLPCVFDSQATTDFELVMRRLDETRDLLSVYLPSQSDSISETSDREKDVLRQTLISAITKNHPERPDEISSKEYEHCRKFLQYFLGTDGGHVFTLNYDLLLYWTLMRSSPMGKDGFRKLNSQLLWDGGSQDVHYLHGALHLFAEGEDVEKLTSATEENKKILDQVRDRITAERLPLFVTEGNSRHKHQRILNNPYLSNSYRCFGDVVGNEDNVLFVFGHSLSDQDDHILRRIVEGSFKHLFVSVVEADKPDVVKKANALANKRKGGSLCIHFYCAESANVWGEP